MGHLGPGGGGGEDQGLLIARVGFPDFASVTLRDFQTGAYLIMKRFSDIFRLGHAWQWKDSQAFSDWGTLGNAMFLSDHNLIIISSLFWKE